MSQTRPPRNQELAAYDRIDRAKRLIAEGIEELVSAMITKSRDQTERIPPSGHRVAVPNTTICELDRKRADVALRERGLLAKKGD